jgi:adenine-specific DNA-methyltransferase
MPGPTHLALCGENLAGLRNLSPTHVGLVDLVYIDPPYNSGNVEGSYSPGVRDWPGFMRERLQAAYPLMKDTGVLIASIDDREHHRLRVVLDEVFGAENFAANIVWRGTGSALSSYTTGGLDYLVAYGKNRKAHTKTHGAWLEPKAGVEEVLASAARIWNKSIDSIEAHRQVRSWWALNSERFDPGMSRYDRYDATGRLFQPDNLGGNNGLHYEVLHPVTGMPVKQPATGWRTTQTNMSEWIAEGRVAFGLDHTSIPRYRRYLDEHLSQLPSASFTSPRQAGSKHVDNLLGERRFAFPKDHEVLMRWIRMAAPKDAVILDFFGGSGTTTEAVLRLNAEDGGTRSSILITSNEVAAKDRKRLTAQGRHPGDIEWERCGIFEHVTRPRIESVLTGFRPDGTLHGNPPVDATVVFERIDS